MKKLLAALLAAAMITTAFAGCASSDDSSSAADNNSSSQSESQSGSESQSDAALSGILKLSGSTSMEKVAKAWGEAFTAENPDVTVFVKQLKAGTYNMKNEKGVVEVPHFTEEDIPELLKYAEDLTIIPSFPSVYNTNNGKIRLGECMLWVIESIRQGTAPSLGCRMVLANAENYEAIYFLTDDEVLDAAACYRRWWEGRKYPKTTWTIDPCYDEPLCGSGYRWW